ncbi:type IV pilin N-terminal domain-containing protein [Halorubellus litoreus]|uniref:Type IV pilin N-terminal domain-containing protein n=1 Tax=Halorubellus litoreus TaxID=755308 RepID=A0ABD5VK03_9EURY
MELKNIFKDEDAVSPVIGVILMVAITVILAAVIGAFVLGIGGSQEQVPQATFNYDSTAYASNVMVDISHQGGGDIDSNNLDVKIGSSTVWDSGAIGSSPNGWSENTTDTTSGWKGGTVSAGSTVSVQKPKASVSSGTSITIVWTTSSGDSSNIISEGEISI